MRVVAVACLLCVAISLIPKGDCQSSPQFCYKQEECVEEDCTRVLQPLPCVHGECSPSGRCDCEDCWEGPSCTDSSNKHAPKFIQESYEEYISPDEPTDYPFLFVRATDEDEAQCGGASLKMPCPCAEVLYLLDDLGSGAKTPSFAMDSKTGAISVAASVNLTPNSRHTLTVYARNGEDRLLEDSVEVVVRVSDVYLNGQSVKIRKLQSMPGFLDYNQSIDISFLPAENDVAVGVLTLGSRVDCELTIDIPENLVVQDIRVEIFTEDVNGTLSVLCEPSLSKGSEIVIEKSVQPEITYDHEQESPFLADTAVFNLGNVTNANTSYDEKDSKVVITFSITLKEALNLGDSRYWVTAGVEYNGEAKLWVGQIGFLVDAAPEYAPTTNYTLSTPINFYKGEVEVFALELNVYKSVANLTVKAYALQSLKPYLMICKLQLCGTGSGYCLDVSKDIASFQVDVASQNIFESTYGFGNIVNGGVANSTMDSRIMMDVVGYLRDDAMLGVESSEDIEVSVNDGTGETVETANFTVKAPRAGYMTLGKTLGMNVTALDDKLQPGKSVKIRVAINIPYSSFIKPVTVTLRPNVDSSHFKLCAVRINHVGNDISCLEQRRVEIEQIVTYTPTGPVATINLGGIANTGGLSSENGVNNVIGIDFVVKLASSDGLLHNSPHILDVTLDYDVSSQLTGSTSVTVLTDPLDFIYPTVPEAESTPFSSSFELLYPIGSGEVAPGEYAILTVKPVIQADTQYKYEVSMLVNSTDVNILKMRITSVGSNIACGLLDSDPVAVYSSLPGSTSNDIATMDLGLVYNFERPGSVATDDDSLVIEMIVQMRGEVSNTQHPVAVSLLVGETRMWVSEGNLTVNANVAMDAVLPTNNTLYLAPSYSSDVVPSPEGTEVKILHAVVIPKNSSLTYVINYTTSVDWVQITDINVTSVGELLLCSQTGPLTASKGSLTTGMYAIVDLGYVCNAPISSDVGENSSTLVIELTLKCLNDSTVSVGTKAVIGADLEVGNNKNVTLKEAETISLLVAYPKSTFKLCCPTSSYYMRPQEIERCNVTMTIADKNFKFVMEIDTPFNASAAAMTIQGVELGSIGRNLLLGTTQPVLSSSANTTQIDKVVLSFGKIDYTATYMDPGDDDIVVYVDVQMAGGEVNTNGTSQTLGVGVSVGQGDVIWVAYSKMTTEREGSDKPSFNLSFSHNNTEPTLALGDKVWYSVNLSHSPDSMAEATSVKGHIFLPKYIQLDSMVPDYSMSSKQPQFTNYSDATGFYFMIPVMFFTDHLVFHIETSIKTDYQYKLTKNWKGTTPVEVVFNMSHHDLSIYDEGQFFSEPMDYVTYDFTVPYPYIPAPGGPPSCSSPVPLGMENSNIGDCQITASFSPKVDSEGHHARLNGVSAWKTQARAGPFLYDRWLKVDLGKKTALTGIRTQGGSSLAANGDLGKFELLHSLDDILYTAATSSNYKAFDHRKDVLADHDAIVDHALLFPVKTRYVVLNLTAYDYNTADKWYNALRVELLGCPIDVAVATDVCQSESSVPLDKAYERGFLVDTDAQTLYVCDTITHGKSGMRKEIHPSVYTIQWKKPDMHCFMMQDDKKWVGLDSRLRNIIGFLPSTGRLFGIMSNSPDSYAATDTPDSAWYLIPKSEYVTAYGSEGFISAITVPFRSMTNFEYSDPDDYANSIYAIQDWKATMSGIYKGSEKVLDWNECCQPTCAANGGTADCTL